MDSVLTTEYSKTCPGCGNDYKSEGGMKNHHTRKHKSTLLEWGECEWCNGPFIKNYNDKDKFCRKECQALSHGESIKGEKHHNYGRDLVDKVCEWCGGDYSDYPYKRERFCKEECCSAYLKDVRTGVTGEDHPGYGYEHTEEEKQAISEAHEGRELSEEHKQKLSEILTGRTITEEHRKNMAEAKRGFTHTQESKEKMGKPSGEDHPFYNVTGPDHPLWKPGRVDMFGGNWTKQRRKALERDGYECVVCSNDSSSVRLEVHHIVTRHFVFHHPFYNLENHANNIENLICLCRKHHRKAEAGKIELETPEVFKRNFNL